jgi:hypothetical protein
MIWFLAWWLAFNLREKRASKVADEACQTGLERGKQEVLVRFESVLRLQVATLRSAICEPGWVFAVASELPFLLQYVACQLT